MLSRVVPRQSTRCAGRLTALAGDRRASWSRWRRADGDGPSGADGPEQRAGERRRDEHADRPADAVGAARPRRGLGSRPRRARPRGAARRPHATARPRRSGDRRRVAGHRGAGADGPRPAPRAASSPSTPTSRRPPRSRASTPALTRQVRRQWPLFLGVDQEGGVVERLRGAATRFPTFMSAGAAGDTGLTRRGVRRERGRAARARLHRRLRAGRRRHLRTGGPDDRLALRLVAAGRGRRAGRRRGRRGSPRRAWCR